MRKTNIFFLALFTLLAAITVTSLVACELREEKIIKCNELVLPEVSDDNIACIFPADPWEDDGVVEDELPPESFVGTVIEETTSYMIVEPNADEDEYEISNRIRVDYITDHIDYLYGKGRKVVITYIPINSSNALFTIKTDDIRHNGFEDFELSVQYKGDNLPVLSSINYSGSYITLVGNNNNFDKEASDYDLYYVGLHDVYVTVDGDTLPLKEALTCGKVTLDGIIAECMRLKSIGKIKGEEYKDGGSVLFDFGDFRIIKYHTLDGYRDVYIGTSEMDINAQGSRSLCIGGYEWKDWGVRLSAKNVSCDGATVVFKQKGGNVTGKLQTGEAFYLERLVGNKWVSCHTNPLIDYAFNMVAYGINMNSETELKTEWKWLYDSLPEGKYRIAKEIMDFRDTGDYDKQIYYAYFDI